MVSKNREYIGFYVDAGPDYYGPPYTNTKKLIPLIILRNRIL